MGVEWLGETNDTRPSLLHILSALVGTEGNTTRHTEQMGSTQAKGLTVARTAPTERHLAAEVTTMISETFTLDTEGYDYQGALLFVVGLLSIYGIAILFLIISLIRKTQGELEVVDHLRDFEAMRRASSKKRGLYRDPSLRESIRSLRGGSIREQGSSNIPPQYHCNDSLIMPANNKKGLSLGHRRAVVDEGGGAAEAGSDRRPRAAWKISGRQANVDHPPSPEEYQELAAITKSLHFDDLNDASSATPLTKTNLEETSLIEKPAERRIAKLRRQDCLSIRDGDEIKFAKLRKQDSYTSREEDIKEEDEEEAEEKAEEEKLGIFPMMSGILPEDLGSTEILV